MDLKGKNIMVVGFGITGLSAVKALERLEANIYLYDSKSVEDLKEDLNEIENIRVKKYLGGESPKLENIDLILKSPGVDLNIPILVQAKDMNIEIITDLELYFRLKSGENILAITGTNGKTTTTKLTGEIFKKAGYNTFVAGNIGVGLLDNLFEVQDDNILIVEASSFQLENTLTFKPHISAIINITPDHIAWHGDFENYISSKSKIFKNQNKDDYTILNYDDKILREISKKSKANLIWFSVKNKLDQGAFIEDGWLVIRKDLRTEKIIKKDKIQIPGDHNLENVLASILMSSLMGISVETIASVLKEFKGVEHRIEYVKTKEGIAFYNDSKGTNPDSTIKAINALDSPIILIAGGHNKGSEFEQLIDEFHGKIKELVLLGETKDIIKKAAIDQGFNKIHLVGNMKEAVELSYKLANRGDNILLSPACASWGMYNNFEERGRDFKTIVESL